MTHFQAATSAAQKLQCLVAAAASVAAASAGGAEPPVRWTVSKATGPGTAAGFPVLAGVEHFEVMRVRPETGTYSHHPHILHDGRRFHATWSNHLCQEDGPGQRVLHATSADGRRWSAPAECFPPLGPVEAAYGGWNLVLTANGLHLLDGRVVAVAGINACGDGHDRASRVHGSRPCHGNVARSIGADGSLGPLFMLHGDPPPAVEGHAHGIAGADDPRFAGIAARLTALRHRPDNCPSWSFRPSGPGLEDYAVGTGNWKSFGHTMLAADGHRVCEPTSYRRASDGKAVRLFRDLRRSGRLYASVFDETARNWSPIRPTGIPDAASRSAAGTLPDGSAYVIGNLTWGAIEGRRRRRDPLVLAVSRDGITFDRAWALRSGAPPVRHTRPPAGAPRTIKLGKGPGFQYPHATVVGKALWVIYSVGKEDVAVTCVPLKAVTRPDRTP